MDVRNNSATKVWVTKTIDFEDLRHMDEVETRDEMDNGVSEALGRLAMEKATLDIPSNLTEPYKTYRYSLHMLSNEEYIDMVRQFREMKTQLDFYKCIYEADKGGEY